MSYRCPSRTMGLSQRRAAASWPLAAGLAPGVATSRIGMASAVCAVMALTALPAGGAPARRGQTAPDRAWRTSDRARMSEPSNRSSGSVAGGNEKGPGGFLPGLRFNAWNRCSYSAGDHGASASAGAFPGPATATQQRYDPTHWHCSCHRAHASSRRRGLRDGAPSRRSTDDRPRKMYLDHPSRWA